MNPIQNFLKSPMIWILGAGVLIGAGATGSVMSAKANKSFASGPIVSIPSATPIGQVKTESMDMVKALDESFANLADAAKPSVVHIRVQNSSARNAQGMRQASGGEGSGVIFRPDGYIVTNDHVVGGFEKVTVILYDGRELPGKVIRAEDSDIAVVKIEANNLPALPFADSSTVRSGEFAMAIGAPFGLDNTVTVGHISALQRTNQIPDQSTGKVRLYWDLIQTDAPINMGNSGGPLVNIEGQVVGINTAIFSPTGTSGGIGFAISSNQARLLAETLIEKGKVVRGYLGIQPENLKEFQKKELGVQSGALVVDLPNDGPAAMAGVKKGDVIVRINNTPVVSQVDVRNSMIKYGPGSKVELEVIRDKDEKTFSVTVKEPPVIPQANFRDQQIDPKEELNIPDFPGFEDSPRVQDPNQLPMDRSGNARLGVSVQDVDDSARKMHGIPSGVKGAVINNIAPKSLAERLKMKTGDVITQIGSSKVNSASDLAAAMKDVKWGETRSVKFLRFTNGASITQDITVTFK